MTESRFHKEYLSLAQALWRIAFYILESEAEAEDAVQEVYARLWQVRDRLDDVRQPKAYAIRMLKNLCLDRMRSAARLSFPEVLPDKDFAPAPDEGIDARQRLEKVLEAVKSLPERQRKVLVLRTLEDLSFEEIARRTGMKPLTCRVLLSQARTKIRQKA